jgi:hypothetical protein
MKLLNVSTQLAMALVLAGAIPANAATEPDAELAQLARSEQRLSQLQMSKAVSDADVGDADSFGRNVQYLGLAQTGFVSLQADCTPLPGDPPLGPDDRCVTLTPIPGTTTTAANDIGRIKLPAHSTKSLICFAVTALPLWSFFNSTPATTNGTFRFAPGFRIESDALGNPALIDPNTGLPFNGAIDLPLGSMLIDNPTLAAGEHALHRQTFTRHCIAGLISKRSLRETYGLSDPVINDFFHKAITIRLNLTVSARTVDQASVLYGVRFYGD